MNIAQSLRTARLAWVLAGSMLLAWLLVALSLDQSALAAQQSRDILKFGAVNGDLLRPEGWWRLVVSQFLHVHLFHMLFNASCVLVIGALLERGYGWSWLATIYLVGGSIGQFASVVYYPDLVSSGASQALMALCGAAFFLCRSRGTCISIIAILAIQLALDLRAAQTVKAGHGWGFVAGVIIGTVVMLMSARRRAAHLRYVAQQLHAANRDT